MGGGCKTPAIRSGPQYYLRTKPSKPKYIYSVDRGDCEFWWDDTIAKFRGEHICSVRYLYNTKRPTGAGTRVLWVARTAAQSWSRVFWCYCLDCYNPFSPTFVEEEGKSLYKQMDAYRNPPGHTFMRPDAMHSIIFRYTPMLAKVVITAFWVACTIVFKAGSFAIDSVLMEWSFFYKFRPYLKQMYSPWRKDTNHKTFIMLN